MDTTRLTSMIFWCQIRLDKPTLGQIITNLISVLVNLSCELGQIMRSDMTSHGPDE